MLATPITELLRHLKAGHLDASDTEALEQIQADTLVRQLATAFRFRLQERRLRDKWEVGLARRRSVELTALHLKTSSFVTFIPVSVFRQCLLMSSERNVVTGLALTAYLRLTPVLKKQSKVYALTSGPGFNLYKAPDGWAMKPMQKRTVQLTEDFLRARGWQFDEMWAFP